MKTAGTKAAERIGWDLLARIAMGIVWAVCVAAAWTLPLYPAIRINLDAAVGQGEAWTSFAVASIVFAAVCVEIAVSSIEDRKPFRAVLYGALGALFIILNILNAIGNAATYSEGSREDRSSQIERKSRVATILAQSSQARRAQFEIAGDATPEGIEAEIQAAKAADAKRWNTTEGCDVTKISAGPTRTFCETIGKLQIKLWAAKRRDEIDAKIAELAKEDATGAPTSLDPFADNVARFLGMVGYTIDADGKVLISSTRDLGKAVGVELLSAFGPAGLLLMMARLGQRGETVPGPHSTPVAAVKPPADEIPCPVPAPVLALPGDAESDPEVHSFVLRKLERCEGAEMKATPLFNLWRDDCAETGFPCGTQKAFSARIRKYFEHDPNGGRPRYRNVRKKTAQPAIRMVVSN